MRSTNTFSHFKGGGLETMLNNMPFSPANFVFQQSRTSCLMLKFQISMILALPTSWRTLGSLAAVLRKRRLDDAAAAALAAL